MEVFGDSCYPSPVTTRRQGWRSQSVTRAPSGRRRHTTNGTRRLLPKGRPAGVRTTRGNGGLLSSGERLDCRSSSSTTYSVAKRGTARSVHAQQGPNPCWRWTTATPPVLYGGSFVVRAIEPWASWVTTPCELYGQRITWVADWYHSSRQIILRRFVQWSLNVQATTAGVSSPRSRYGRSAGWLQPARDTVTLLYSSTFPMRRSVTSFDGTHGLTSRRSGAAGYPVRPWLGAA